MATASLDLVNALRETATRLEQGASYAWSRMGSCNCGHLAQTLTQLTSVEIQAMAMEAAGDWTEQVQGYCSASLIPLEDIFNTMLEAGLTTEDIMHLERLSDPTILGTMSVQVGDLDFKQRHDVVRYLRAWAVHLEEQLLPKLRIPQPAYLEEMLAA